MWCVRKKAHGCAAGQTLSSYWPAEFVSSMACYGAFVQNVRCRIKLSSCVSVFEQTPQCRRIFVMPVTFTCVLFSFGERPRVSDGPLTSCLQPAVFQLPPPHRLDVSCAPLSGQQTALWLWAAYLKWLTAGVTVSFSDTIYKAPVPFYCLPSPHPPFLPGFPLRSPPAPSHCPPLC